MKQYQKLYYRSYYVQDMDGNIVPTSRSECFAKPEIPTKENPYKQRWFYDPETGVRQEVSW